MGDADAVARLLVQLAGGADQLGQVGELGPVHRDVHAVAHHHPVLAAGERLEQVGERQELPVDADHDLQVEPVRARVVGGAVVEPSSAAAKRITGAPVAAR